MCITCKVYREVKSKQYHIFRQYLIQSRDSTYSAWELSAGNYRACYLSTPVSARGTAPLLQGRGYARVASCHVRVRCRTARETWSPSQSSRSSSEATGSRSPSRNADLLPCTYPASSITVLSGQLDFGVTRMSIVRLGVESTTLKAKANVNMVRYSVKTSKHRRLLQDWS